MRSALYVFVLLMSLAVYGCRRPSSPEQAGDGPAASGGTSSAGSGATAVGPDVGAVTPVTGTSLDDASGGGVNSAAMKKAKGIAAQGVGSVNNAERQGNGVGDD